MPTPPLSLTASMPSATSSIAASTPIPTTSLTAFLNPFTPDAIANGFATLIGALLGAMLAYMLQRKFQQSLEHKASLTAAHRLMFSLLQQINTIVLVHRDYFYSELENPGRFLSIPALPTFDTKKNVLELSELTFLLDDREARELLYEFYIAQENYIEALNQLNLRSTFHLERLQPALAISGIGNGSLITNETVRLALGEQIFGHAVNATDNCVVTLKRAFNKLHAVKMSVRPYLVRRFRTNDFTDFEFPDTWGLMESQKPVAKPHVERVSPKA